MAELTTVNRKISGILSTISGHVFSLELSPDENFDFSQLQKLNPIFVSVTWIGVHDGPVKNLKPITFARKLVEKQHTVLLHLPGKNLSKKRVCDILSHVQSFGVRNILALRGDERYDQESVNSDFLYAADLVKFVRDNFPNVDIGVAGYPNGHPKSKNIEESLQFLRRKIDHGGNFVITQSVFNFEELNKFTKELQKTHNVPVLPGIFAINSYESMNFMVDVCKVKLDSNIIDFIQDNRFDDKKIALFGIELCKNLVNRVLDSDLRCFHVFTMNNLETTELLIDSTKINTL